MKRYYYDEPLAAAWMAKHFGMKFEPLWPCVSGHASFDDLIGLYSDREGDYVEPELRKYYIHLDSLYLLEPMVGDFIHGLYMPGNLGTLIGQEVLDGMSKSAEVFVKGGCKIILRNNIPFHSPKEEA